MEHFPGHGQLAINGPHPPPPPGLMSFTEFKARHEQKVCDLIMAKEQRLPTIEKVNFMLNHEYSTYIQRNLKPKKGTASSINSWGMSTIGEKLCDLEHLPNLADVAKSFQPTTQLALPQPPVALRVARGQEISAVGPVKTSKVKIEVDIFEVVRGKLEKNLAELSHCVRADGVVLLALSKKVKNLLHPKSENSTKIHLDILGGPLLLLFGLMKLEPDYISTLLVHNRKLRQNHQELSVAEESGIGPLKYSGLYYLVAALSNRFSTDQLLFQAFVDFTKEILPNAKFPQVDTEQFNAQSAELKKRLKFLDSGSLPKVNKNPRFPHNVLIETLAKILSVEVSLESLALLYAHLNGLAISEAATDEDIKIKDACRIVVRTMSTIQDHDVFIEYGVRQFSNGSVNVMMLQKGLTLVAVDGEKYSISRPIHWALMIK